MTKKQTLLLIYPDFLGDFLLFSPFLIAYKALFESTFEQVVWLCNPAIMPLVTDAQPFFPNNLRAVPVNFSQTVLTPKKWLLWVLARRKVQAFLRQQQLPTHYSQVWCPSFMPWLANGVLTYVNSPRKLSRPVQNGLDNWLQHRLNTALFRLTDFDQFVFYQHHDFFQQAFQQALPIPDLHYAAKAALPVVSVTGKAPYVVLVTDSAAESKEWPPEQFVALTRLILSQTDCHVVVLGVRPGVLANMAAMLPADHPKIHNLMGKTTVLELISLVKDASLVVCNDSFALHAATLMASPVICVTHGGYKGRYWPYPQALCPIPNQQHFVVVQPNETLGDIRPEAIWQIAQTYLLPSRDQTDTMSIAI
jgi:ADP-heptose:LPS heptosyltransferase